jgi:hypothetical protein
MTRTDYAIYLDGQNGISSLDTLHERQAHCTTLLPSPAKRMLTSRFSRESVCLTERRGSFQGLGVIKHIVNGTFPIAV